MSIHSAVHNKLLIWKKLKPKGKEIKNNLAIAFYSLCLCLLKTLQTMKCIFLNVFKFVLGCNNYQSFIILLSGWSPDGDHTAHEIISVVEFVDVTC